MSSRLPALPMLALLLIGATVPVGGSSQGATPRLKADTGTPKDQLKSAARKMNEALTVAGTSGETRAKMAQLASSFNELDLNYRGRVAGSGPRPNDADRPRSEWQRQLDAVVGLLLDLLGPQPRSGMKLDPAKGSLRDDRVRVKLQEMRVLLQQFDALAK